MSDTDADTNASTSTYLARYSIVQVWFGIV